MADYGVALMSEIALMPGRVHSAQALAAATGLPLPTVRDKYKYGFVTDIESDTAPRA
jgi:hypothetical protein